MRSTIKTFLSMALLFVALASAVHASDYFVLGRVYSAYALPATEEVPRNPLTGVSADQILAAQTTDNWVATTPRNLVNLRVIRDDDGGVLGSFIARRDGGYLISFTAPAGGIDVRFVVEETATSQVLFEGGPLRLAEFPEINTRFVLVTEESAVIGSDLEFAPEVSSPAKYTAIFTRVGKVELQTENPPDSGIQVRLIDTANGRVTVPETVASDLRIPRYQDAPWGGNLYLFGAFSQELYSLSIPDLCYTILVEDLDAGTSFGFSDPLVKTKYTVDFTAGTVDTKREKLGPLTIGGVANCYKLTEPSSANNVFWSFPDLLALWRTGTRTSKFRLTIQVENLTTPADFTQIADFTDLLLHVDNTPVQAQILPLDPSGPDSAQVYTPGPLPPSDLTTPRLGAYPLDYGGTADPTCEIFNLQGSPTKYVAFKLTAHHPNGYLRSWYFKYERNDKNDEFVLGKTFNGTTMDDRAGVRISSAQSSTYGFQDMYLYLDPSLLQPSGLTLGGCAYRFVIHAARRATDGYHYLSSRWDQDLHYVQM